jgi:hypothetical protein
MFIKLFPYITLVLIFAGCTAPNELIKVSGECYISSDKRFRLRDKFFLADSSFLSTTNIYEVVEGNFLTFYKSGRVLHSMEIKYEGSSKKDTFNTCGYYKLEGNKLSLEMTHGLTTAFRSYWNILVIEGKIVGDTLLFTKDRWYGSGKNNGHFTNTRDLYGNRKFYIKSKKPAIPLLPDW